MAAKYLGQAIFLQGDAARAAEQDLTKAYHALQKPDLLAGITKTYEPKGTGQTGEGSSVW